MKKLFIINAILLLYSTFLFAQKSKTYYEDTKRVENMLEENKKVAITINEESSKTDFSFEGCTLKMRLKADDEGIKLGVKINWDLSQSNKVTYLKTKEKHNYKVDLVVPADAVSIDVGIGKKLSINATPDSDDTTIAIENNDIKKVQELVFRLNRIVDGC